MNCRFIQLTEAYADRELEVFRAAEFEHHLKECSSCSREHENVRALSDGLRSAEFYFEAPAGLKRTIAEFFPATGQQSRFPVLWNWKQWVKWLFPISAIGALVLLAAPAFFAGPNLVEEVAANHVRSLMAEHLTDVRSSDQHTVKPWFSGKLDFAPPVKDLAAQDFPLAGGRLDYLKNRPVAALVYRRRDHVINVFIWPSMKHPGETLSRHDGYNVIGWSGAGMRFCAISDLNVGELQEFSRMMKSEE
jgi:anti-sigma factor RsiW